MKYKRVINVLPIISLIILLTLSFVSCGETASSDYDTMSKKEYKDACKSISYDELAREGNNRIGDKVKVYGKVVQMLGNENSTKYEYRVALSAGDFDMWLDDDIEVFYDIEGKKKMLEDDFVTIYGEINGDITYETVKGGERTVPSIIAYYVDIE